MPSVLPEFEYDIFISYRQKDNAYDEWVTEFVSNLKRELEATFKVPIGVYFDRNSQDGLLESHDVGKSLDGKLNSLVFVPILSQTYCDPECFAWKYEMCVFNRLAQSQPMGRDIRLSNGNVASRILPVQIHDLDADDLGIFERETGGPPRSIPFIYREAGVNRPLRPSDNRTSNLNNTEYRNQVNKVANAIKEIIQSIQKPERVSAPRFDSRTKPASVPRWFWVAAVIAAVSLIAYLLVPQADLPQRIAVLPFQDQTNRADLKPYSIGMASTATSLLSTSRKFSSVSSLSAVLMASQVDNLRLQEYGDILGADFLLTGYYQLRGEQFHIVIEFIDARTETIKWSRSLAWDMKNLGQLEFKIRQVLIHELDLDDPGIQHQTLNSEAYAHFQRGQELLKTAYGDSVNGNDPFRAVLREHAMAIRLDSFFIDAWTEMIAVECFLYRGRNQSSALGSEVKDHLTTFKRLFPEESWQKQLVLGEYHLHVSEDTDSAILHLRSVLESNPHNEHAAYGLSKAYSRKLELKEAIRFAARLLEINRARAGNWTNLGLLLSMVNDPSHALKAHLKAWELSQSRNLGRVAMLSAIDGGHSMSELPPSLKDTMRGEFLLWDRLISRDWQGAKKISRQINDRFMTAMIYHHLAQNDSAKLWVTLALQHHEVDSSNYFMLVGDRDNALSALRRRNEKPTEEATLSNRNREIMILISFRDFEGATERLRALIRDYPGIDHWTFYRHIPFFDEIRSSFPPFRDLIQQPPPPPLVNIESLVDW